MTLESKTSNKVRKENCLYLRYRKCKPPGRDGIRLLHPSIIDVRFPRQKSAKFCHLEFESKEAAVQALKHIKKTNNKDVVIHYAERRIPDYLSASANTSVDESDSPSEAEESPKVAAVNKKRKAEPKVIESTNKDPALHVSGLPDLAVQQVLQNLFPGHSEIVVGDKKKNGKKFALVHFKTSEEATRALEDSKDVSVNGDMLTVKFHE